MPHGFKFKPLLFPVLIAPVPVWSLFPLSDDENGRVIEKSKMNQVSLLKKQTPGIYGI